MASCGQCSTEILADSEIICDVCKSEFCSICLPLTASEVKVIQLKKRTMLICCKTCKVGVQGLLRNGEKIKHLLEEVRLLSSTIADKNELLEDKSKIIQLLEKSSNNGAGASGRPTSLHLDSHSKPDKSSGAASSKKVAISKESLSSAIESAKTVSTVQQLVHLENQTVNSQNGSSIIQGNENANEIEDEGFKVVRRRRNRNRPSPSIPDGPQQSGRPGANSSRRGQNGVIGTGGARDDVRVAPKKSFLHVSRFSPDTPSESVKRIILDVCPEVECEAVKSKHPEHYSSFKLTVNSENRATAMDPKNWPAGIYINRFFLPGRWRVAGEHSDN